MVVAGSPSPRDRERLEYLAATLSDGPAVRYFEYAEVEVMVERLAALLLRHLGPTAGERFYVPVPRGGFIAAGMLSYCLGLAPSQMPPADRRDRSVVLVDDVALTGQSISSRLSDCGNNVVVALLVAHRGVREAIERQPGVEACVVAVEIESSLAEHMSDTVRVDAATAWSERLADRLVVGAFPDPVAFPWSEPDSMLWDRTSGKIEEGWRLVSPERSLKSRAAMGPPSPDRVHRSYRFPADLIHGRFGDGSVLACVGRERRIFHLDRHAARIWGALGTLGDERAAMRHLEEAYPSLPETLSRDVDTLLPGLLASGLLERTAGS